MVAHTCNPSYSRGWDGRIALTQEAEVAVSWDRATALQPRWQSKTPSQKKRKKGKEKKTEKQSIVNERVGGMSRGWGGAQEPDHPGPFSPGREFEFYFESSQRATEGI